MQDKLQRWFDAFAASRYWLWYATALLVAGILIFSTPYVHYLPQLVKDPYWQTVIAQANDDFIYQPPGEGANAFSHESKRTFRLAIPMLMRALHLGPYAIYALQFLVGILFVAMMLRYTAKHFGDRKLAVWMGVAVTSVHFGTACFTDVYAYFSGWAFFFLFAAVFFRHPVAVFLLSFAAAWTDERGVIALAYVMLYWQYIDYPQQILPWRLRISTKALAALAALMVYAIGRLYLQSLGYYTPFPGLMHYVAGNVDVFQFGVLSVFEGLWLLILYKYYVLLTKKRYELFFVNGLVTTALLLSSFVVWDVTRSGSFMLLEVFLSAWIVFRECGLQKLYKYTSYSAIVCLLIPPYYVITDSGPLILQRSIIYVAAKSLLQHFTGVQ